MTKVKRENSLIMIFLVLYIVDLPCHTVEHDKKRESPISCNTHALYGVREFTQTKDENIQRMGCSHM